MTNLKSPLSLALGLLTAAAIHAQTPPTAPTGFLGQKYTELGFGLNDRQHDSNHGYGLRALANTPILPGEVDTGGSYTYNWNGGSLRSHSHTLAGYATAYIPAQGVKPFVNAGLGWRWTSAPFNGTENRPLWDASAGVEIPVGGVTLTPRITYEDDFKRTRKSRQAWVCAVEASYWVSKESAVFGSFGKSDVRNSSADAWVYQIGLRARL